MKYFAMLATAAGVQDLKGIGSIKQTDTRFRVLRVVLNGFSGKVSFDRVGSVQHEGKTYRIYECKGHGRPRRIRKFIRRVKKWTRDHEVELMSWARFGELFPVKYEDICRNWSVDASGNPVAPIGPPRVPSVIWGDVAQNEVEVDYRPTEIEIDFDIDQPTPPPLLGG